jgi:hypothetical protein
MIRAALIAAFGFLELYQPGRADPAPAVHYAPVENLEDVNVALIDTAKREIDLAAYVLTDWPVMQAQPPRWCQPSVQVRCPLLSSGDLVSLFSTNLSWLSVWPNAYVCAWRTMASFMKSENRPVSSRISIFRDVASVLMARKS